MKGALQHVLETSLFSALSEAGRDELATSITEIVYHRRDVIVREGDAADAMYVVLDGGVQVSTETAEGESLVLARLGPGQHFGEQALLAGAGGRRNATVTAEQRTRVAVISAALFQRVLRESPAQRDTLLDLGERQLRERIVRRSR